MKIIKKSPFKMKYQSPLKDNGVDEVVVSSGGDSEYDPAYDTLTDYKYVDPDKKIISEDDKPVVDAAGDPITQEEMDYYTNLNKLYPEYIFKTGGKRKVKPGFRGSEIVPGALMPKSTSVRHTQDLMKDPDVKFWSDAKSIIDEMPGYKK